MQLRSFLFIPLSLSALHADALGDLKTTLERLRSKEQVKARVEYQFWRKDGEGKGSENRTSQGHIQTWVEDGPQGLKILWNPQTLQQLSDEAKAEGQDPEKETPVKDGLRGLSTLNIVRSFNGAESLLQWLQSAQFQVERQEVYQGQPARLLEFKLTPKISAREKKHLKNATFSLKVWVGADGVPLGAWQQQSIKGSFMLIGFESSRTQEMRFVKVGNRLLVSQLQEDGTNHAMGMHVEEKSTLRVHVN